jgi:hypothetical protein
VPQHVSVEPAEQVYGTQKVRIAVRAKREGVEESMKGKVS